MIATATALFRPLLQWGLVPQIVMGIIAGVLLALLAPTVASDIALLGQLFIAALQAVAPFWYSYWWLRLSRHIAKGNLRTFVRCCFYIYVER